MLSLTLVGATDSYIVLLFYSNRFNIKCPIDGTVRQWAHLPYLVLLMFNDNLFNFSHSAILWSSLLIKYSVSALFVSFVKDPSVLTRKV